MARSSWLVVGAVNGNGISGCRAAWTPDLGGMMPPRPGIRCRSGRGNLIVSPAKRVILTRASQACPGLDPGVHAAPKLSGSVAAKQCSLPWGRVGERVVGANAATAHHSNHDRPAPHPPHPAFQQTTPLRRLRRRLPQGGGSKVGHQTKRSAYHALGSGSPAFTGASPARAGSWPAWLE